MLEGRNTYKLVVQYFTGDKKVVTESNMKSSQTRFTSETKRTEISHPLCISSRWTSITPSFTNSRRQSASVQLNTFRSMFRLSSFSQFDHIYGKLVTSLRPLKLGRTFYFSQQTNKLNEKRTKNDETA